MRSITTGKFWKFYSNLPQQISKQAKTTFLLFQENPFHPSLNFKKVHSSKPIYSVRISREYRAVGIKKKEDVIIWFWIGNHSDYEKFLKNL